MHTPSVPSYLCFAGCTLATSPSFAVVITEEWANVIVFSFRRGNDLLANCVDLEHILLHTMNSELLSFILLFTNPSGSALETFQLSEVWRDTSVNGRLRSTILSQ